MGTCLCQIHKSKAMDFFLPHQFGVACSNGTEKVIHTVRQCIDNHWTDDGFVLLKVDLTNAFNFVSRQSILTECAAHFPELLPWVSWCYSQHPSLWHTLGTLSSQQGVHQGDPLGSFLFALVLHRLVLSIADDKECSSLLSQCWYIDDGVLAGHSQSVHRALSILQQQGPSLGLHINQKKK